MSHCYVDSPSDMCFHGVYMIVSDVSRVGRLSSMSLGDIPVLCAGVLSSCVPGSVDSAVSDCDDHCWCVTVSGCDEVVCVVSWLRSEIACWIVLSPDTG